MKVNIDKINYEIVAHRKTVKPSLLKLNKTEPRLLFLFQLIMSSKITKNSANG